MSAAPTVLCVDDEPNVLKGIKRTLGFQYRVHAATSGAEGIEWLSSHPCDVVISDMRMPGMNGAEFLKRCREQHPDMQRILLTGQADMDSAVAAVNEGQIFRFLLKPCPPPTLRGVVGSAVEQGRLMRAEKELLDGTLRGSLKVITEVMSATSPGLFAHVGRIRRFARHIGQELEYPRLWELDVAAGLSYIGLAAMPDDLVERVFAGAADYSDQQRFAEHPKAAAKLLQSIPRLENVVVMVKSQLREPKRIRMQDPVVQEGARILAACVAVDAHLASGGDLPGAVALALRAGHEERLLNPLMTLPEVRRRRGLRPSGPPSQALPASQLTLGMVLAENARTPQGTVLAAKGQEISEIMRERLVRFAQSGRLVEPLRVMVD